MITFVITGSRQALVPAVKANFINVHHQLVTFEGCDSCL